MALKTKLSILKFSKPLFFMNRQLSSKTELTGHNYDLVIAGGGMVGTALACALGSSKKLMDKSILLLEGGPFRETKQKDKTEPYSNRVVSLNPGTRLFFESLGAWKYIEGSRYSSVKKMQVWDSCSQAMITFDNPGLQDDVSYIIENDLILHALNSVLTELKPRVDVKYDSKVHKIQLPQNKGSAEFQLENDENKFSCNLLIGAEGFKSATRQAMDTQWLSWNYNQSAVVATLELAEPTENIVAWQRFLPKGPIALLPLTNELSSMVWTTDPKTAANLVSIPDENFVDAVNDALWKVYEHPPPIKSATECLEKILSNLSLPTTAAHQLPPSIKNVMPKSRASFPLGFGHAAKYVAPSAALIGDAAHRVHPLAGQGVNLGFGDAECLARNLGDAVYRGEKLGSLSHLLEYERQRQCHNFPTMLAVDGLQKLYNTTALPVVLARSLGMQVTNALTPLKRLIMQHASV